MALFSLSLLFFSILLFWSFRAKRKGKSDVADLGWSEASFFEAHGGESEGSRLEVALRMGCARLGLPGAVVMLHSEDRCRVANSIFIAGEKGALFRAGQEVPQSLVYCGMLGKHRESVAIDYAALSEWRRHRGYTDLGIECYIGVRREISSGESLTVAFYGRNPRDSIFTDAEKRLVGQLANWIVAIREREAPYSGASEETDRGIFARA